MVSCITEASLGLGSLLFDYSFFQVSKSYLTSWLPQCSVFFVCLFVFFLLVLFPRSSSSSKILLASVFKCILHTTVLSSLHPCFPPHHPLVFHALSACCSNTRWRWLHSITILSFPSDKSFGFLVTDLSRKFLLSDLQGSCGQYNEHFPRPHSPWSFCRTSRRFCKLHQVTHPSFNPCWFPKAFLTFQTTPIHSLYQVLLLCAKLNFEDFLNFQS